MDDNNLERKMYQWGTEMDWETYQNHTVIPDGAKIKISN